MDHLVQPKVAKTENCAILRLNSKLCGAVCCRRACSLTDLDEVQAAIIGDERGDLFAILDQLDPDTLPDSRVGLLGFDDDALGVRSSSERVRLESRAQVGLLVLLVMPLLLTTVVPQLPGGTVDFLRTPPRPRFTGTIVKRRITHVPMLIDSEPQTKRTIPGSSAPMFAPQA
uniref:Uncharacterized protein n=1 Tax=Denticeps clupeoides TaxID=299321 RepID=A0AAY4AYU0_9TELE